VQLSLSSASSLPTEEKALVTYICLLCRRHHVSQVFTWEAHLHAYRRMQPASKSLRGIKRWISTSQRRRECIRRHILKPLVTLTFDHWPPKSDQFINRGLQSFPKVRSRLLQKFMRYGVHKIDKD